MAVNVAVNQTHLPSKVLIQNDLTTGVEEMPHCHSVDPCSSPANHLPYNPPERHYRGYGTFLTWHLPLQGKDDWYGRCSKNWWIPFQRSEWSRSQLPHEAALIGRILDGCLAPQTASLQMSGLLPGETSTLHPAGPEHQVGGSDRGRGKAFIVRWKSRVSVGMFLSIYSLFTFIPPSVGVVQWGELNWWSQVAIATWTVSW